MKPRNKYEKRVAELNATLSETISAKDAEWYKKVSRDWDFGHGHFCYFTIYTQVSEFEVKRLYRGYKFADRNTEHFFFVEIMREFNDGERRLYFGKQRTMGSYYDCFSYNSDIQLRGVYKNYAGYDLTDLFDLSCASRSQSTGKRIPCSKINPNELARVIRNNPVAENLFKTNDWLFGYLLYRTHLKETCRAITLAKRHGFVFTKENASLWLDMVYAIIKCGKDWHNPVYIAPNDLLATHNRFMNMLIRKDQQNQLAREYERLQKELEQNKTSNEQYIKRRKRFYDMVLSDGLVECRVLRDVDAFLEEATFMQHCVYRCRYFDKPYSLILSATINGQRIETVEVDLSNYTIKQCYGKHDHFTMHHQRILDLVNAQMDTIKAYNRNKRNNKIKIAV